MVKRRHARQEDFREFFNTAKNTFSDFLQNDPRAQYFEKIYRLNILPGSRNGGNNNRVVDIFWGSRPFETIDNGQHWHSLTEYGSTLLYECDDSGWIMISLYPANTDNRKPIESCIYLKNHLNPKKLKNKSFLKKNWKDLMAYMEYTSLDGKPTLFQRLRVFCLRHFKHMIIDNKWRSTKSLDYISGILKWILTVGVSGAIIYILTILTEPKTTETVVELKKTNRNLERISKQLDSIESDNNSMKKSAIKIDSVELETKQILNAMMKNK